MRVKLMDEVTEKRETVVRQALWATKCDVRGFVFQMEPLVATDPRLLGTLCGIFDRCARDDAGHTLGNGFGAHVCSFLCAHKICTEGLWRQMEQYEPFARNGAELAVVELVLSNQVRTGEQLVAEAKVAP